MLRYFGSSNDSLGFIATDKVFNKVTLCAVDIYLNGASTPVTISSIPGTVGDKVTQDGFTLEKRSESDFWVYNNGNLTNASLGQKTTVDFVHSFEDRAAPAVDAHAFMTDGSTGGGTTAVHIRGDLNSDGIIDGTTHIAIAKIVFGQTPTPSGLDFLLADVDTNGRINASDYGHICRYLAETVDVLAFIADDTLDTGMRLTKVDIYMNDAAGPLSLTTLPEQVGDVVYEKGFALEKTAGNSYRLLTEGADNSTLAELGKTSRVDFIHEKSAASPDIKPSTTSPTVDKGILSTSNIPKMGDNLVLALGFGCILAIAGLCLILAVAKRRKG